MAQIIAKRGLIVTMGTAARRSNFVPESRFDIFKEHLPAQIILLSYLTEHLLGRGNVARQNILSRLKSIQYYTLAERV